MIWSENARYYAVLAVAAGVAGYLLLRNDLVGPAILFWGAGACLVVVATPRIS